jgi:hypothetical protein
MSSQLKRYWLRFSISPGDLDRYPTYAGLGLGCGATAYSRDDLAVLLDRELFHGDPVPEISELVEDVNIQDLDQGKVIPNMGSPRERGVWFPRL